VTGLPMPIGVHIRYHGTPMPTDMEPEELMFAEAQSCFDLILPCCLPPFNSGNSYSVPLYIGYNLLSDSEKGSKLRVCLESQRRLWTSTFEQ
jgi:hypothetical protein